MGTMSFVSLKCFIQKQCLCVLGLADLKEEEATSVAITLSDRFSVSDIRSSTEKELASILGRFETTNNRRISLWGNYNRLKDFFLFNVMSNS